MSKNGTKSAANDEEVQAEEVVVRTPIVYFQPIQNKWLLVPHIRAQFERQLAIIDQLHEIINQKWTPEQHTAYTTFLNDFTNYLTNFAFTLQVHYYQDHQQWVEQMKTNYNPVGFQLYEKQLDYLQKKFEGYDFKLVKKKNKDPNAPKPEQKKQDKKQNKGSNVPKPSQKKQDMKKNKNSKAPKLEQKKCEEKEVKDKDKNIVRQVDAEINLQKLMNTDWDTKLYLSTNFLAKKNANIVFIGQLDSGKSTLTGNIMKELNEVDDFELNKARQDSLQNKMEAWEQAAISDVIPEERQDGKTRQFAKLNFSLEKKRFTLFDAPGHRNYVPNMIMGACQADIAVLVISAKEGEFESGFRNDGQTKEHAMLAKTLGLIELIVTVTKMGTVGWSQKRYDQIQEKVTPYLEDFCGFQNVVFIPIDSLENANIHKRIESSWYKGPAFLEYLDNVKLPERNPMGPLRIPVIDKFKEYGNIFVYGKVESGTIIEDQTVTILPERAQLVIKEIFNAKDERLPFAMAGENVKINVKGIDEDNIARGNIICNNLNFCQESSEFKVNINLLELPKQKKLLSSGYECIMHVHTFSSQVEIVKVNAKLDKETGKMLVSTFLRAGEKGVCIIKADRPLCIEKYDFMPSLGRFTLRDEGKTIGYGQIIGIKPAKKMLKEQNAQLVGENKAVEKVEKAVEKVEKTVEKVEKAVEKVEKAVEKVMEKLQTEQAKVKIQQKIYYATKQVVRTPIVYFQPIYNQWLLVPHIRAQFERQLNIIEELREIINQKWNREQHTAYTSFLNDFTNYLTNFAFTLQVRYYQDYQQWVEIMKTKYNPVGFQLYEKQLDYLQKKMEGYDFKQDKKTNKDPRALKPEKKKYVEKQPKDKEKNAIPQTDPEIKLQKHMNAGSDTKNYFKQDMQKFKDPKPAKKKYVEKKPKEEQNNAIRQEDSDISLQNLMNADWDTKKNISNNFLTKENANIVFIGAQLVGEQKAVKKLQKGLAKVEIQGRN